MHGKGSWTGRQAIDARNITENLHVAMSLYPRTLLGAKSFIGQLWV
jgi:hypothetical protein